MGRSKLKRRGIRRVIKGGLVRLVSRKPTGQGVLDGGNSAAEKLDLRVPANLSDSSEEQGSLHLGSIMSAILLLGLAWIVTLSWLVSRMPER